MVDFWGVDIIFLGGGEGVVVAAARKIPYTVCSPMLTRMNDLLIKDARQGSDEWTSEQSVKEAAVR